MEPSELADTLFSRYRIFAVPINGAGVQGCRITPNVYTSTDELDVLVEAIKELTQKNS
jgi:hypothetical protein